MPTKVLMGFTWDKGNVLRARLRNLNLRLITDLTTYFISSALEALAAASAMSSPILLAGVAIAALEDGVVGWNEAVTKLLLASIVKLLQFCASTKYSVLEDSIFMAHTSKDKDKLLARVRRIKGQTEAVERAIDTGEDCEKVLQLVAACRGAMNGLMAELIDGHLRHHVLVPEQKPSPAQIEAADELMAVVRRYLS
jgi:FrmR/RcnR family transcriptional regulator, repressor of frmRAB operon